MLISNGFLWLRMKLFCSWAFSKWCKVYLEILPSSLLLSFRRISQSFVQVSSIRWWLWGWGAWIELPRLMWRAWRLFWEVTLLTFLWRLSLIHIGFIIMLICWWWLSQRACSHWHRYVRGFDLAFGAGPAATVNLIFERTTMTICSWIVTQWSTRWSILDTGDYFILRGNCPFLQCLVAHVLHISTICLLFCLNVLVLADLTDLYFWVLLFDILADEWDFGRHLVSVMLILTIVKQFHILLLDFVEAFLLFLHFFLCLWSRTLRPELLICRLKVNELYFRYLFFYRLFFHWRLIQFDANLILVIAVFRIRIENLLARNIVF